MSLADMREPEERERERRVYDPDCSARPPNMRNEKQETSNEKREESSGRTVEETPVEEAEDGECVPERAERGAAVCAVEGALSCAELDWGVGGCVRACGEGLGE